MRVFVFRVNFLLVQYRLYNKYSLFVQMIFAVSSYIGFFDIIDLPDLPLSLE